MSRSCSSPPNRHIITRLSTVGPDGTIENSEGLHHESSQYAWRRTHGTHEAQHALRRDIESPRVAHELHQEPVDAQGTSLRIRRGLRDANRTARDPHRGTVRALKPHR